MRKWFTKPGILALAMCVCGLAGAAVGFGLATASRNDVRGTTLRDENTEYTYTKPLLACNIGPVDDSPEYRPLDKQLTETQENFLKAGTAENISIHFRDLDAGLWTTVGTDEEYAPGSLMKVPILIAYLKQSETDPSLLGKTITITEDPTPGATQDIPPEETVVVGATYSVEQLLRLMTLYSDNRAMTVLMQYVDIATLHEILSDLGIPIPETAGEYAITPRIYSRLFRILYNATYLRDSNSELALTWLAAADYTNGLTAGVPADIAVAHKFGESPALLNDGSTGHELHDCGIVYTDTPYLLCVMTRGAAVSDLENVIATISRQVYAAMAGE